LDFPDDIIRFILSFILAIERWTQNRLLYEIKLCVETEEYHEIMKKLSCFERLLAFCPCSVSEWEDCQNGIAGALGKKRSELRVVEANWMQMKKQGEERESKADPSAATVTAKSLPSSAVQQQQLALLHDYSQRLARELIAACQVAIDHTEVRWVVLLCFLCFCFCFVLFLPSPRSHL
jgi:hypothetical protein